MQAAASPYANCERCPVCFGAVYWARPARLVFACTHDDATAAGFGDDLVYREFALPVPLPVLPTVVLLRDGRTAGLLQRASVATWSRRIRSRRVKAASGKLPTEGFRWWRPRRRRARRAGAPGGGGRSAVAAGHAPVGRRDRGHTLRLPRMVTTGLHPPGPTRGAKTQGGVDWRGLEPHRVASSSTGVIGPGGKRSAGGARLEEGRWNALPPSGAAVLVHPHRW